MHGWRLIVYSLCLAELWRGHMYISLIHLFTAKFASLKIMQVKILLIYHCNLLIRLSEL
jgi:hypothetical protein